MNFISRNTYTKLNMAHCNPICTMPINPSMQAPVDYSLMVSIKTCLCVCVCPLFSFTSDLQHTIESHCKRIMLRKLEVDETTPSNKNQALNPSLVLLTIIL